jgi:hypothetical protein
MAFFDFDKKIQTLLIAGALASIALAPGCGGQNVVDPAADTLDMPEIDDPILHDDTADPIVDIPEIDDPILHDDTADPIVDIPDAVDPAPDALDGPDEDAPEDADEEDAIEASLPHGFLKTRRGSTTLGDGRIKLMVSVRGGGSRSIEWAASSGHLEVHGDDAIWTPPSRSGVHSVQATVRSGDLIGIETFKMKV